MTLKTVFFLGDESRYGMAHLDPILDHFDVLAVVVGTQATWRRFRTALAGQQIEVGRPPILSIRAARRLLGDALRTRHARSRSRRLRALCERRDAAVVEFEDVNSAQALGWLKEVGCDLVLSAAYPQIFGAELLAIPPAGAINFHPSLLPKFRGAHPHFWTIAKGESESGVTAHYMTEEVDQGGLVAQRSFPIEDFYYSDLYAEIERQTPELVRSVAAFLARGDSPIPQSEQVASRFRNDREIHRRLFWGQMTGRELYDLVRTEVAFCFFNGEKVAINRATLSDGNRNLTNGVSVPAGIVVDLTDQQIAVSTGRSREVLVIRQVAGRSRETGVRSWVRDHHVVIGARFD